MLKSIEKILVPIDYSKPGFQAAWIAFSIARSIGASITLIHIHLREKALRELVVIEGNDLEGITEKNFDDALQKIVGDPSYEDLKTALAHSVVELSPSTFNPAREICDYAKGKGINLIVMGSRIHSKLENLLLGNVSTEVLKKAPCPVTIVH